MAVLRGLDVRGDIAELGRRLDEISGHEHVNGRPLLSVVVVHRDGDQMPGEGFFRLARRLGVQREGVEDSSSSRKSFAGARSIGEADSSPRLGLGTCNKRAAAFGPTPLASVGDLQTVAGRRHRETPKAALIPQP